MPAVSERTLAALGIPVLIPRNASEVVTFGLHAVALSRACGTPVALKIVADVADGAWVVDAAVSDLDPLTPQLLQDGRAWRYRQSPALVGSARIVAVEAEFVGPRTDMVRAYAAANGLDEIILAPAGARVGLVATGPAYDSMMQALGDLGADEGTLAEHGIALLRVGLVTPLASETIRNFATSLEEVIVVEDKTPFLETQVKEALYDLPARPRVLGRRDALGAELVPAEGELTPGRLHDPLRRALRELLPLQPPPVARAPLPLMPVSRTPYFCSGCPHNRSTALPEGSIAAGGIGCHTLVTLSRREDSAVTGFTQMGGEGAQWIGQAPFTTTEHIFQNLGDGTFAHSGQLSIQACVAAGVNITYKLLHNDVVAMTGAQEAVGARGIPQITHKLTAEGVSRIIVVADDPQRHRIKDLAPGTKLWHRDRLEEAQRVLRETPGVTVLVYDQHCATDARRRRRRGTLAPRPTRVVINEDVCEGCGDCGVKSNCLSVQPVMTPFGEKTRIDQTSCNTDYSCLAGDCPAFLTVRVPDKQPTRAVASLEPPGLPDPTGQVPDATWSVLLTGVGGTGIVTVNQVLATAAMRAGYQVELLDQIGLSQKAGPVVGHLRFNPAGPLEPSNRITPGRADAILAFDLLTAVEEANLAYGDPTRTRAVASTSRTPTGPEVYDRSLHQSSVEELLERLRTAVGQVHTLDMLAAAQTLLGSTTSANLLLVGAAVQSGALPLPPAAVEEAVAINGVAIEDSIAAFRWGRLCVADPTAFAAALTPAAEPEPLPATQIVPELAGATMAGETRRLVEVRAVDLVGYQDLGCARDYVRVVDAVWRAERAVTDETRLSEAVARYLYKLTAYKDEYEVARLLTRQGSRRFADAAVPGGRTLTYRLHPPMLRALGRSTKIGFTPPTHVALRTLAPLKRLRGTAADPFGYAHVRRVERELLHHYRRVLHDLVTNLSSASYERAVDFARLPDVVRGYEEVKLRSVQRCLEHIRALGLPLPDLP